MVTRERLIELTEYDHITGRFIWRSRVARPNEDAAKVATWNTRYSGMEAGYRTHGYFKLSIDDKKYYAHRLVWLLMNGEFPNGIIDHINQDGLDNRYSNLRIATRLENYHNTSKVRPNKTGFTGAVLLPSGRFMSQKTKAGAHHYLGSFDTPEEAHAAWKAR